MAVLTAALVPAAVRADELADGDHADVDPSGFFSEATLGGVTSTPSAWGGEFGLGGLKQVFAGHGLIAGPRVGILHLAGSGLSRTDFNVGAEGTLWMANALGPGFAADVAVPLQDSFGGTFRHFRYEPYFALRMKRFQGEGAWGVRAGGVYDTRYKWGLKLEVSLQFSGVRNIAEWL